MNELLALPPEARNALLVFIAVQVIATQIIARLPASALRHRTWGPLVRALHWLAHARFTDEAGTLKLPGRGYRLASFDESSARRAYDAYCMVLRDGGHGEPPPFDDLSLLERGAWSEADRVARSGSGVRVVRPALAEPAEPAERGRSVMEVLWLVLVVGALFVGASTLFRCKSVQEALLTVTPGVPPVSSCTPHTWRCSDSGAPLLCSDSRRLWNALPRRPDGTERVCPGVCEVVDAGVDGGMVARCRETPDAAVDAIESP